LALAVFTFPKSALAEKILAKSDDWQVYTDGRVGGFFGWVHGQGRPNYTYDSNGNTLHNALGGGWDVQDEQGPGANKQPDQGTVDSMRIRSGFIGNQLGLGVRGQATPWTTVTGYIQIWAWIESNGRIKSYMNTADVRQGYAKLEGRWGSLLAGRTRTLFSRGATDIDTLYAHRWGVGFPGISAIDSNGPTLGQIGFGVLGSGFASGIIYATPVIAGLQLSVGAFDPIQSQGNGSYTRTKYVRPEGEMTFERNFATTGKVVLFVNGAYQKIYKNGHCTFDPVTQLPCNQTAAGVGYGGRFELGPVHLGVAGHYGQGLGFNYALEVADAAVTDTGFLRKTDGYYVQSQVVLGKFDLFAGWGIVRAFRRNDDYQKVHDPRLPVDPNWTAEQAAAEIAQYGIYAHSVISYQMGINGGIVYNLTPQIHLDVDYFRAKAAWCLGESQVLHVVNTGLTFNW
jgi:hypothetical protein